MIKKIVRMMFGRGDVCQGCMRPWPFCSTGDCAP